MLHAGYYCDSHCIACRFRTGITEIPRKGNTVTSTRDNCKYRSTEKTRFQQIINMLSRVYLLLGKKHSLLGKVLL